MCVRVDEGRERLIGHFAQFVDDRQTPFAELGVDENNAIVRDERSAGAGVRQRSAADVNSSAPAADHAEPVADFLELKRGNIASTSIPS